MVETSLRKQKLLFISDKVSHILAASLSLLPIHPFLLPSFFTHMLVRCTNGEETYTQREKESGDRNDWTKKIEWESKRRKERKIEWESKQKKGRKKDRMRE